MKLNVCKEGKKKRQRDRTRTKRLLDKYIGK